MNRAVFVDKDGTLIRNVPYNIDPEKIEFYPDVLPGLKKLQETGYRIIVVTNQPGVALGYFTIEAVENLGKTLTEILSTQKIVLNGFYYCPHYESGTIPEYSGKCTCRKPLPGMIEKAASNLQIDVSRSWMIGDILNDIESGNRAGCRTILIDNGNETEWIINDIRRADFVVENFSEAVKKIIENNFVRKFGKKGALYDGADEKLNREFWKAKSNSYR